MIQDPQSDLIKFMRDCGIAVTRENYIEMAWGNPQPEWNAELESELPEELQDWSLFETKGGEIVLKGQ